MKRFLFILLTALVILSCVSCNGVGSEGSSLSSESSTDTNPPLENTETVDEVDTTADTDASAETDKILETDEDLETNKPSESDAPLEENTLMTGFVIETSVYTTKFEGGKDVHLEGMTSGVYAKPDRSTSCGSLPDGTKVQVIEVSFEGDDITVGWARVLVGASQWEVYIRTSQLKCFVLHEVGFPIEPERLIGKSRLVSGLPESEKATVAASFLALGYRTAFMEDGSTMFISNENFEDQLIQNADGSWVEYDGDGGVNRYFDSWQYDLLTEYGIPTDRESPKMKIALLAISSKEGVAINFSRDVTLANIKAYAETLKGFGYTAELLEAENDGKYLFQAKNQKYALQLAYSDGQGAMLIKKDFNGGFDLTAFIRSGDIIGNYPSDQLEEFEQMIAANGGRVEHRAKSTRLVFPDGTADQFFDGSWLLENDAIASTKGGYFPSNACTAELMSVYPSTYGFKNGDTVFYKADKVFVADFFDASIDKAQQFTYALVIRCAFSMNVRESEEKVDGIAVYTFYAENYNYAIEFKCVEGQSATMKIMNIEGVG